MGVLGLSSLIKRYRKRLLCRHSLCNCSVVIDGSNLMYQLCNTPVAACGGDYHVYASKVKKFFTRLKECGVTPYVVMDGSTQIKRQRLRKKLVCVTKSKSKGKVRYVMPLLTRIVFVDTLKEMKVPVAQCSLDADREIVALARGLNCAVMSNDSDFCIFNVEVILLKSLDRQVSQREDGSTFLKCEVYRMKRLLDYFGGVDASLLPLVATMAGNDQMPREICQTLYRNVPKRGLHALNEQHRRIIGLFRCFQNRTLASAVKLILRCAKKEQRKSIAALIYSSVKWYLSSHTNLAPYLGVKIDTEYVTVPEDLTDTLETCEEEDRSDDGGVETEGEDVEDLEEGEASESESSDSEDDEAESECEGSVCDTSLPEWFWEELHQFKIPSICMDVLHRGFILLLCQIEEVSWQSSHTHCLPVLRVTCGILDSSQVKCYVRKQRSYMCIKLMPSDHVPEFGSVPGLHAMRRMTVKERRGFLESVLHLSPENLHLIRSLCDDLQMFAVSLLHWLSTTKPNEYQLVAAVFCMFSQQAVRKHRSVLRNTQCARTESQNALKNLQPLFQVENKWDRNHSVINITAFHAYSQLQATFYHLHNLNLLLGCPYLNTDPTCVFHGSLYYRLICELLRRPNPHAYIEHLLGKGTELHSYFVQCVKDLSPDDLDKMKMKHRKKKKRVQKKEVPVEINEVEISSSEELEYEEESNRFSVLARAQ